MGTADVPPQLVALARDRLAAGAGPDEILAALRDRGLGKLESAMILAEATGRQPGDFKVRIHHSPVWADRREADEYYEELFWRAGFLAALVGEAIINKPDEDAAEVRDRHTRARERLRVTAEAFAEEDLVGYHHALTEGLLGKAFAALVELGRRRDLPGDWWRTMAEVSEILCLHEFLEDGEPAVEDPDYVHAAAVVRRIAGG